MCLIKSHFLPKISFKSIEVYKILYKSWYNKSEYETPFRCTKVFLNTTMEATKHWKNSLFKKSIHGEGVHAYRDLSVAARKAYIGSLYHARGYAIVIKAIIPRFTVYWTGKEGDIAASKLYITDEFVKE